MVLSLTASVEAAFRSMIFSRSFSSSCLAASSGVLATLSSSTFAVEDPLTQFERDVRPVLEERCFECHGADKQKGGLRLDQKAGMFAGGDSGEPAVVPGKSDESQLIKFVTSSDPDDKMPPKGARLAPREIAA